VSKSRTGINSSLESGADLVIADTSVPEALEEQSEGSAFAEGGVSVSPAKATLKSDTTRRQVPKKRSSLVIFCFPFYKAIAGIKSQRAPDCTD
jgi:hypothetical protein